MTEAEGQESARVARAAKKPSIHKDFDQVSKHAPTARQVHSNTSAESLGNPGAIIEGHKSAIQMDKEHERALESEQSEHAVEASEMEQMEQSEHAVEASERERMLETEIERVIKRG